MSEMALITLEENSDISQAKTLVDKIRSSSASGIRINAEKVERIDASIMQLLISTCLTAGKHGWKVEILDASEKFIRAARLLGAENILLGK